jgi:hypothetical protein
MASNFVEHPAKVKQAAYLIVGTTKTQVSHGGVHLTNFLDLLQVIDSYSQPIARLFFFSRALLQIPVKIFRDLSIQ